MIWFSRSSSRRCARSTSGGRPRAAYRQRSEHHFRRRPVRRPVPAGGGSGEPHTGHSVAGVIAAGIDHTVLGSDEDKRKVAVVEFWIGGVGVVLYLVLLVTLGVITIRKGHWVMFIIGFFLPLFWLIGALLPPVRERY
jgi:hypothetical protein